MKNIRSVRKVYLENNLLCIAKELLDYLDIKVSIESIIKEKSLQERYDYQIVPLYLIQNQINVSKYTDNSELILLTPSGIGKIIANRRQTETIRIAEIFGAPNKFIKEKAFLDIIKNAFKEYESYQQFKVKKDNNSYYYIDLLIILKNKDTKINLAIEVDENNHSSYNKEYETTRENYIREKLNCDFIRFNPDEKNFNIGSVINQIMTYKNTIDGFDNIKYTEDDDYSKTIINDILGGTENPSIFDFVEEFTWEAINENLSNFINVHKDIKCDKKLLYKDIPLLKEKDIIEEYINKDDENNTSIISKVKYFHKKEKKDVVLYYTLKDNIINIQCPQARVSSSSHRYIRDYISSI